MEKEFEALKTIKIKCHPNSNPSPLVDEALEIIEQALTELKAIKEPKPSEAMECSLKLYKMVESAGNGNGFSLNEAWKYHKTIKQYLLKAQELKKENAEYKETLRIIFEKRVDVFRLKVLDFNTFNQLQRSCRLPELTQEEFECVKNGVNRQWID